MPQENRNIQPPSSPKKPPFWKALLVKLLRSTSGALETTAIKLETEPFPGTEEKTGFLQKIQQLWTSILGKIRLIIPVQLSSKLSNTALTGIISGLVVIVFLITLNLFDRKPSEVATVAPNTEIPQVVSTTEPESIVSQQETASEQQPEIPPVIEKATSEPTQEETVSKPEVEIAPVIDKQITSEPSEEETASEQQPEIPPITEEIPLATQEETASEPEQEIPPLIEKTPAQQKTVSEELETIPPIPLTPEETLIAAIQNQVGEISLNLKDSSSENRTFSEIIESIQANFLNSDLTIKINNDWYSLEKNQQDKLAAEILQRSQELDFTHLEITDLQGKLIARNPVVGTEMIIFKRK